MSQERRTESLWAVFVQEDEDRRDAGLASVGFDALRDVLDDVKHGRRPPQPNDRLNRWLESAFWAGYSKDYLRLAAFKHDLRERFGGKSIEIAPNNVTSAALRQIAADLGAQRTHVATRDEGKAGNA